MTRPNPCNILRCAIWLALAAVLLWATIMVDAGL